MDNLKNAINKKIEINKIMETIFIKDKKAETERRMFAFLILAIYLGVLLIFTGLVTDISQKTGFNIFLAILGMILALVITYCIPKAVRLDISLSEHTCLRSCLVGILMCLTTFVIYFIYHRGYFPGGFTPDSYLQYKMAMGDVPLNNWHPVLHTLLIYKLPIMFGRHLGMIVTLQIFYFSLAVGYVSYALYRAGIPKTLIFLYGIYIWTNQYLITYMMYSWKDQSLMISGLVLFGMYIRIVSSKSAWLMPWRNRILFSLVTVVCGYMRHNAILYVLPLVVIVLIMCGKIGDAKTDKSKKDAAICQGESMKKVMAKSKLGVRISVIGLIIFFYAAVKLLYLGLSVEKADNLIIETIGMPITVWGNVMKNCPEVLPDDTRMVMYELADAEAWENIYVPGSFEELRYSGEFHNDIADKLSYKDVMRYTWQCFRLAPEQSWTALAKVTASVWSTYAEERPTDVDIWGNRYGIEPAPGQVGMEIDKQMLSLFSIAPARVVYGSIGSFLLCMLIVACWAFPRNPQCMLHILPIFAYCFGTCPLLAGNYYRFFLIAIPIWIPVVLLQSYCSRINHEN